MEQRVNFYAQDGRFLFGYTLQGTFAGEMRTTKELLAAENGCCPEDIRVKVTNEKEENQNMTIIIPLQVRRWSPPESWSTTPVRGSS